MENLDRMPFETKSAVFGRLADIADISTLSKEERRKYEYSLKVIRDTYAIESSTERRGREEGMKEGMKKGESSKQHEIARNMKMQGFEVHTISICTGLSEQQIEELN